MSKFQTLPALCVKEDKSWMVWTYITNSEVLPVSKLKKLQTTTGSTIQTPVVGDPLYAKIIVLSVHATQKAAQDYKDKVLELTGVNYLYIGCTGVYHDILDPNASTSKVVGDSFGVGGRKELLRLTDEEYQESKQHHELQSRIRQEMEAELINDSKGESLEAYKSKCVLLIKRKLELEEQVAKVATMKRAYELEKAAFKAQHISNPSYEGKWLPLLEKELKSNTNAFDMLKARYQRYAPEFLDKAVDNKQHDSVNLVPQDSASDNKQQLNPTITAAKSHIVQVNSIEEAINTSTS